MRFKSIRHMFPDSLPEENPIPDKITDRYWAIAVMYINDPGSTLDDVKKEFGISRERVRQILDVVQTRMSKDDRARVLIEEGRR